jgi:hypothetical protein
MAVPPPATDPADPISQWLGLLKEASLSQLETEAARVKASGAYGKNEETLFGKLIRARISEAVEQAAAQEGPENFLRWTADKIEQGEFSQDFAEKVLTPMFVDKSRQPVKDWGGEEVGAFFSALPGVAADLAKGVKAGVQYGPSAAAGAFREGFGGEGTVLGSVFGLSREASLEQRQAKELFGAATQQGTMETARLLQRGGRILLDDVGSYSREELQKRFKSDLEFSRAMNKVERGERDVGLLASIPGAKRRHEAYRNRAIEESKKREAEGRPGIQIPPTWEEYVAAQKAARPELTEDQKASISPLGEILSLDNALSFGSGFGVKQMGKTAATTVAERLGKTAVKGTGVGAVRRVTGDALEAAGRKAGEVLKRPLPRAVTAAGTAAALGADPTGVLFAAVLSGNRAAGKLVDAVPNALGRVGRAVKTPFKGPFRTLEDIAESVGVSATAGILSMAPLAAIGETAEERGSLLAGGAVFGGAGGAAQRTLSGVVDFGRSLWAPEGKPAKRTAATSYGTGYDQSHATATEGLNDAQFNRVEGLRSLLNAFNTPEKQNQLYVLPDAEFDAMTGGNAQGVFVESTGPVNIVFVKASGSALRHEAMHAVFAAASPAEQQSMLDAVTKAYDPESFAGMKAFYEERSGRKLLDIDVAIEIIAENGHAALSGLPLEKLGVPTLAAKSIYDFFGRLAERLNARDMSPGGPVRTSEALPFTPSFLVVDAINNVKNARALDSVTPEEAPAIAQSISEAAAAQAQEAPAPAQPLRPLPP